MKKELLFPAVAPPAPSRVPTALQARSRLRLRAGRGGGAAPSQLREDWSPCAGRHGGSPCASYLQTWRGLLRAWRGSITQQRPRLWPPRASRLFSRRAKGRLGLRGLGLRRGGESAPSPLAARWPPRSLQARPPGLEARHVGPRQSLLRGGRDARRSAGKPGIPPPPPTVRPKSGTTRPPPRGSQIFTPLPQASRREPRSPSSLPPPHTSRR